MLDLTHVFKTVSEKFPDAGVACLLIGGFAVNHYGYTRNTLDVDFMIASDDMGLAREIMIAAGFTNVSAMDNVVLFYMPDSNLRVDFLQVTRATVQKLVSNANNISFRGYNLKIPALKDLLAMKLFALTQSQLRRVDKDLPDIAYLTVINGLDLEKEILPLCRQFATDDIYRQIRVKVNSLS